MNPVCRVCMDSSVTLVDIFAKRKQLDKEPTLVQMLNECVNCKVTQDDPLPKQICLTCVLDTQNAFRFKRRCEQSYKQFWEMLNEDRAINELFAAEDWIIPECTMDVDTQPKNDIKEKGHKENKLKDLLQDEIPIACVKKEKPDTDAEESDTTNFLDNPLQSTEGSIDISCVKTEKLDDSEEEDTEKILPDNSLRLPKNTEEYHLPHIGNANQIDKGKPNTWNNPNLGEFISINTEQGKDKKLTTKHKQLYKIKGSLFKCPQCPKTSISRTDIELHMHVHTAYYKCIHCPKSYHKKYELQTHLTAHSGQRPYVCPYCFQTFNHTSNLNKHISSHVDRPPYKCNLCPKSFLKKEDAVTHILGHNATRTYKCPHCNSGLRQHNCRPVHERGKFTYINTKELH